MIVKNTNDGAISIAVPGEDRNIELSPGWNEMDNVEWAKVRPTIVRWVKAGQIEERFITVATAKDIPNDVPKDLRITNSKDKAKIDIPATLADINNRGHVVDNIIKETYHEPTLEIWNSLESRSDVKAKIMTQQDRIAKGEALKD